MTELVIVESPGKVKTISKYLGPGYTVKASVGHVRDLPQNDLGVNLETFEAEYEFTERGKGVVADLKKIAKDASEVWLATDDDREGEAIAWHLQQSLNLKQYKRVTFNEITQTAIKKAFQSPRLIDQHKVNSQQGRRLLDRIIGYTVSPALSKATGDDLSAGRVQSVALRLAVDLEARIRAFVKTNHFGVRAKFNGWHADWDTSPFVTEDSPYFLDRAAVERLANNTAFTVITAEVKPTKRNAPPPLNTSTLQQAASVALEFSSDKTMQVAQKLYELGAITYHRTDSLNLSDKAIADARDYLTECGKAADLPDEPNKWKSGEGAQEAHEAIRPSDFKNKTIDGLDADQQALYQLIYNRALASQMKPATYDSSTAVLETGGDIEGFASRPRFIAKSKVMTYAGWLQIAKESENEDDDDTTETALPKLNESELINSNSSEILEKTTQPPKRLTEASLVKALEREGIGRPSTYAAIIKNILTRGYIKIESRKIFAQPLGEKVVNSLVGNFTFIEIDYTRKMEEALDRVASGQFDYRSLVKHTHDLIATEIKKLPAIATSAFCCGACNRPLRKVKLTDSVFWSCTGYESGECKQRYQDEDGAPYIPPATPEHQCPECKTDYLERKKGKAGWYWKCQGEECGHGMDDKAGVPTERTVFPCPLCTKPLIRRPSNGGGHWWGCSGFKDGCSYKADDNKGKPAERYQCPNCTPGTLRRVDDKSKDKGKIWICSEYSKGCKGKIEDKRGKPVLPTTA